MFKRAFGGFRLRPKTRRPQSRARLFNPKQSQARQPVRFGAAARLIRLFGTLNERFSLSEQRRPRIR